MVRGQDAVFDAAAARGIKVVATFHTTPCWASSAPDELKQDCAGEWWDRNVQNYPPVSAADYGEAAAWVARRWGDRMAALEIWNEPNEAEQDFLVAPDPAVAYAALVKAAYGPVKIARPELPVIVGSTSLADRAFIERLYDLGIRGYHDGISIHPYNESRDPDDARTAGLEKWTFRSGVPWIRESMVAHGDGDKGLWLTEFGWSTCAEESSSWCVSEAEQSEYINDAFRIAHEDNWSYVKAMLVYNLRNKGTDPADRESQFGMLHRDFTPKPGWDGFRNALDFRPPETSITSGPSGAITQTSATFAFTSTESGSFKCKLDTGTWESCSSPKALSSLSEGEHTFSVQAIDAAGNADATPATRTFTVDSSAPTARPPAQSFVQPSMLGTSTVAVKLTWPASSDNATGSSELKYDVEQRRNTGAFVPIASNMTALSIARSLAQSSTYRFRVRARDAAGNMSPWATAAAFRPIPYQESSKAIAYGGTWERVGFSAAFGGYVKSASTASAKATLTFTGKNVAVVMPKRSGLGSAQICLDGANCSTVGLTSATSKPRQVVYKRDRLSTATHKITVTRASGRIDLDGFVVLR